MAEGRIKRIRKRYEELETIIAIAVAFAVAALQVQAEMLTVQYKDSNGKFHTLQVEEDVEVLRLGNLTSLTLPDGLTKLHSL